MKFYKYFSWQWLRRLDTRLSLIVFGVFGVWLASYLLFAHLSNLREIDKAIKFEKVK